jgi:hypothetical protein
VRTVIHVLRNPSGWWDVRTERGDVLVRYLSEFQAWEAGRNAAERMHADLALHQHSGPVKYEEFDEATKTLRPGVAPADVTGSFSQ